MCTRKRLEVKQKEKVLHKRFRSKELDVPLKVKSVISSTKTNNDVHGTCTWTLFQADNLFLKLFFSKSNWCIIANRLWVSI